ncbi:MAG: hypothetical protein JXA01_09765 [Dehalococcoidia bacterium]|nr:hypothetical protein [Dehalococcoidia bacterium]
MGKIVTSKGTVGSSVPASTAGAERTGSVQRRTGTVCGRTGGIVIKWGEAAKAE